MGQFKVYQDYACDATLVSNTFIDYYMKDANDAQIKIYLYLLRTLSSHRSCSISDLADQFNYTEKDVQRSLKFWERNGLLSLEYDENKKLCGVRLLDVVARNTCNNQVSLAPVVPIPKKTDISESRSGEFKPVEAGLSDNNTTVSSPAEIKSPEPSVSEEVKYSKPRYSADDIIAFKSKDNISELIFVVEQYLGKPLTPTDIKTLMFFSVELGFSYDLIDYLFDYCVGKGKKDMRYIEKVAISWKEEGITTPKQAAKSARKYDKIVYQVMNALGKTSSPTQKEADFVSRWSNEFSFDFDIISEACNRTVLATDSHRIEYADKILTSWYNSKVHHKSDIEALDSAYEKKKKGASSQAAAPSYKQFTQNDYEFDELEKKYRSN